MNFDQLLVELGVILNFTRKRGLPNKDSGGVLCVFLHNHTEDNYVEEHLLTFLSFKYFVIRPLKKCQLFICLGLI